MDGKAKVLELGGYETVGLAEARKTAREMRARVLLGYDPALEKVPPRRRPNPAHARQAAQAG